LDWTSRETQAALIVLVALEGLIKDYGLQLVLEAIININNVSIERANKNKQEDDYLYTLKHDLEIALENYKNRYE